VFPNAKGLTDNYVRDICLGPARMMSALVAGKRGVTMKYRVN
jgi:hypothetical protein